MQTALVYITGHGHGHLSQTIEVLAALHKKSPDIRYKIISSLTEAIILRRVSDVIPLSHIDCIEDTGSLDIGMPMIDAMSVDSVTTIAAYQQMHKHWEQHIQAEQQRIMSYGADIVISNVGYIPLKAASNINIPAVAMCSLDWASTWAIYGSQDVEGKAIYQTIVDAYNSANIFLQMRPHLPMDFLSNKLSVPPVVRSGDTRRKEIDAHFPQCSGKKLILVSMGGMHAEIDFARWPEIDDVIYIITGDNTLPDNAINADDIKMEFSDLIASMDAVVTKTGYGMVVESAANQVPLFYVSRQDWPENEPMLRWSQRYNRTIELQRPQLEAGLDASQVSALFSQVPKTDIEDFASGASQCADRILSLLDNSGTNK